MKNDKKILVSEVDYKFLIAQNEQLKEQNKQLQASSNGKSSKFVKILNELQVDSYTGEKINKQPKKNYDIIKKLELDEMAEHHLLFLETFKKFLDIGADRNGLLGFIKDWLLEDAGIEL